MNEELFREILKKFGIKEDEIVHVGDHKVLDYYVPSRMGIKSFFLDRTGEEKGEHVVHSLREFEGKIV